MDIVEYLRVKFFQLIIYLLHIDILCTYCRIVELSFIQCVKMSQGLLNTRFHQSIMFFFFLIFFHKYPFCPNSLICTLVHARGTALMSTLKNIHENLLLRLCNIMFAPCCFFRFSLFSKIQTNENLLYLRRFLIITDLNVLNLSPYQ